MQLTRWRALAVSSVLTAAVLALAACVTACRTDFTTPQDEGDTTKDSASDTPDGAASTKDGGATGLADGAITVDAEIFTSGDAAFSVHTGPASDAACQLTPNGSSCGTDASACCSGVCGEAHKCTGNGCTATAVACTNALASEFDLNFGGAYIRATSTCCVNTYCVPDPESIDGKCGGCVASGMAAPARVVKVSASTNENVYFWDSCCANLGLNSDGTCK